MKAGYTIYYGFNFGFSNIVCVNLQSINEVEFYNRTDSDVDNMINQHNCVAIFRIKKYHKKAPNLTVDISDQASIEASKKILHNWLTTPPDAKLV